MHKIPNYKYKKQHKKYKLTSANQHRTPVLYSYNFGLKVADNRKVTWNTLDAARYSVAKRLKRLGELQVNAACNTPITSKPVGVRMGKGVGSITNWVCSLKKGDILFAIKNVPFDLAKKALQSAAKKLPMKTKFIKKKH